MSGYTKKVGYDWTDAGRAQARLLAHITSDQARYAFAANYERAKHTHPGEPGGMAHVSGEGVGSIGRFFLDFLRTRLGGHGVPDALARTSWMIEAAGDGAKVSEAFARVFGVTLDEAHDEFCGMLDATLHKPHERFRGTVWERLAPPG
jgi:hypothetical protein